MSFDEHASCDKAYSDLAELNDKLRARVAELEQRLGNLLARIHRDGGHYIAEHGWAKAEADADAKIIQWIARNND